MVRHLAAIMFTDIAGYTELAQRDEAGALSLLHDQEKLVRPVLEEYHGREVKAMGDGLLIEFPDALEAVECGAEVQERVHERNLRQGVERLDMRIGIHLGDVQEEGTDILGDAVNIASRVEPLADPGGVCVSYPVYDQVRNKLSYKFESIGPRSLKGVRDAVDVYRIVFPWSGESTPPIASALPRLAVLPFDNISPDPQDAYFADGMTEEMISVLSQIGGLRVIARTSVNQYRGTTKSIAQIGSELGVTSILEGSVRKAGTQLRITVQLIDARTQEHRWAHTYDRRLENVFSIQADVAENTAGALKIELLGSERAAIKTRPTSSVASYESYLRGIQASAHFLRTWSPQIDLETASRFEQAIREDPQFAAAYARLAEHLMLVMGETRSSHEVIPRVRELVSRALELDQGSSEAHVARGELAMQVDHDWPCAEAEFQQGIALNPSDAVAHAHYGVLLLVLQRLAESKKQFLAAFELDPLNLRARSSLAAILAWTGDLEAAIVIGEKLVGDFPEDRVGRGNLASAYVVAGRFDDAVRTLEPLATTSDPFGRFLRASVLAGIGQLEEACAFLADWELGRIPQFHDTARIASLYSALGDRGRALDLLEQDEREGEKALWAVYTDVPFDPIRDDPRFMALLRDAHLPTTLTRDWRLPQPH